MAKDHKKNSGAVLVEFVLGALLLICIIGMAIELAWYLYQRAAVSNALSTASRSAVFSASNTDCEDSVRDNLSAELGKNGFGGSYSVTIDYCSYVDDYLPEMHLMRVRIDAQLACFFCRVIPGGSKLGALSTVTMMVLPPDNCSGGSESAC